MGEWRARWLAGVTPAALPDSAWLPSFVPRYDVPRGLTRRARGKELRCLAIARDKPSIWQSWISVGFHRPFRQLSVRNCSTIPWSACSTRSFVSTHPCPHTRSPQSFSTSFSHPFTFHSTFYLRASILISHLSLCRLFQTFLIISYNNYWYLTDNNVSLNLTR